MFPHEDDTYAYKQMLQDIKEEAQKIVNEGKQKLYFSETELLNSEPEEVLEYIEYCLLKDIREQKDEISLSKGSNYEYYG